MSIRFALPLMGIAMIAAAPAAAQDAMAVSQAPAGDLVIEAGEDAFDGTWGTDWQDAESWRGTWDGTYTVQDGALVEGELGGTFFGPERFIADGGQVLLLDEERGWYEPDGDYDVYFVPRSGGTSDNIASLGREQWLADCRVLMIGDPGNRDDSDNLWATRYCEAYLHSYELRGTTGFAAQGYGQPVMVLQPVTPYPRTARVTVREQWLDAPAVTARRAIPPLEVAPVLLDSQADPEAAPRLPYEQVLTDGQ